MSQLRSVVGYETRYLIDESGNIFSQPSNKKMATFPNKDGYLVINLYQNNTCKQFRVNRLVAIAFIDNYNDLPEVNHIDEDKMNNHISNLEWTTRSGNMEHSFAKEYELVNPEGILVKFKNLNKFCRDNSLNVGHVHRLFKGQRKSSKGWTKFEPT